MNKMTATALSLSAVLGVSAAIGGGTYALFSDTDVSKAQSVQAGTLNLVLGGNAESEPLAIAPSATDDGAIPGESYTKELTLVNDGTTSGFASFIMNATGTENGCMDPEAGASGEGTCDEQSELLEQMRVTVQDGSKADSPVLAGLNDVLLQSVSGKTFYLDGAIAGKLGAASSVASRTLRITFSVPEGSGNEIQTDTVSTVIDGTLSQKDQKPAATSAPA